VISMLGMSAIGALLAVGLPMYSDGTLEGAARDLAMANGIGVVLDALIIPWVYLWKRGLGRPVLGRRNAPPEIKPETVR